MHPTPAVGTPAHLEAIDLLWAASENPTRRRTSDGGARSVRRWAEAAAPWVLRSALAVAVLTAGTGIASVAAHQPSPPPLTVRADAVATAAVPASPTTGVRAAELDHRTPVAHPEVPRPEPIADTATVAAPLDAPVTDIVELASGPTLPSGKGMWIWKPELTEGGDAEAIVAKARQIGLTHLYVRTGSSVQGFHGAAFLDQILPVAHREGIQVFGWDFPYFRDVGTDIDRSLTAIRYRTPDGHAIDGFVPDIETPSEGTVLTPENARSFSEGLRAAVGPDYPLLVAVPRPSAFMIGGRYPYDDVVGPYDAIIPMVYWLNRQPDTDVVGALEWLRRYGKPIIPVGQAYDGAPEGGRPGPPPADEIRRFLNAAAEGGAAGVSFWSWQHATDEIWLTYAAAPEFRVR